MDETPQLGVDALFGWRNRAGDVDEERLVDITLCVLFDLVRRRVGQTKCPR